mgnify:CR=1 FL=1
MEYIDVNSLKELPSLNNNYRYLDFLGGTKQYRCYVVPKELPRCLFIENNRDKLDEILLPIYIDEHICISQDSSYALPAFYIISLRKHYKSITELTYELYEKINFWVYEIRKAMKEALKIEYVNIYYEEKTSESANVHYWLMPVMTKENIAPKLHYLFLKDYLEQFKLIENRNQIKEYNEKMRKYIYENKIPEKFKMKG